MLYWKRAFKILSGEATQKVVPQRGFELELPMASWSAVPKGTADLIPRGLLQERVASLTVKENCLFT
jgi:hypothetical protein